MTYRQEEDTEALLVGEEKFAKRQGTPWWRAIFTTMSTMAGAGVLGLPYAIKQSGWSGIPLLVIVCFMAAYTGKILIKCMDYTHKLRTYQDIGRGAFGEFGYYLTLIFQQATLIAVGILFLILAGSNAKILIDIWLPEAGLQFEWLTVITAFIVWPFIVGLKTMREISFVAVLGALATTFTVIVICVYSVKQGDPKTEHKWVEVESFPFAFATFVFAFGGHNIFPSIQDSMRTPANYNKMLYTSFFLILLLYVPPCVFGYTYFGTSVKNPILGNLGAGVVTELAIGAITIHIWFTLPIIANPVNLWLEEVLNITSSNNEFIWRFISRSVLLGLQTLIACTLREFGDVMAIIGASTVSATIFFLPCFFYLKMNWDSLSVQEIFWNFLILLFATVGSVIGMISACVNLVNDLAHTNIVITPWVFNTIMGGVSGLGVILILLALKWIHYHHKQAYRINTIIVPVNTSFNFVTK